MHEVGAQLQGWAEEPGLSAALGRTGGGRATAFLDGMPCDSLRPWAESIQAYRSAQSEKQSSATAPGEHKGVLAKLLGKSAATTDGSSGSSSCPHSGRNPRRHQLPALPEEASVPSGEKQEDGECRDLAQRCKPTPHRTRVASLLQPIERWCIPAEELGLSVCCGFHRGVSAMMRTATEMSKARCNAAELHRCVQPARQCAMCLVLADLNNMGREVCDVCNHRLDIDAEQDIGGVTPKLKCSL